MHKIGADVGQTCQIGLVRIYGKGSRDYIDAPLRRRPLIQADELVGDPGATLS
jgi:hypothetical protein